MKCLEKNLNDDSQEKRDCHAYIPRRFHQCYGIIVTNHKHCRFVIARMDTEAYPLVFLREWTKDQDEEYVDYYTLYGAALTATEADEILELLKNAEKRKANTALKRYFKPEGVLCDSVGEVQLDDAIPDAWYDAWKEMNGLITFRRDYPGYYEADVKNQVLW
jgi:hypothetical protein